MALSSIGEDRHTLDNEMLRVISVALEEFMKDGYLYIKYRLEIFTEEDRCLVLFVDLFLEAAEKTRQKNSLVTWAHSSLELCI